MIKNIAFAIALLAVASTALAQDKKVTAADFVGTWNIEMMSHQIALVVEPGEGNKVTATMMMPMGGDVQLKGEVVERTMTLVGVKPEGGDAAAATPAAEHGPAPKAGATPKPIVVVLQDDGTIAGEMMTNMGPAKWTGEKLKTKKKG